MRYSIGTLLIGFTVVSILLAVIGLAWRHYPSAGVALVVGGLITSGGLVLDHIRRGFDVPGRLPAVLLVVSLVLAAGIAAWQVANWGALAVGGLLGIVAYHAGPGWASWALTHSGVESD